MMFVTYLLSWYVEVPTAEHIGLMGQLCLCTLGSPYITPMCEPLGYNSRYVSLLICPGLNTDSRRKFLTLRSMERDTLYKY